MNQLEPCPRCHRHVKVSETACPFCTRPLADAFANRASRGAPGARLGRAAMFAFGALVLSQGACGDNTNPKQDAASVDAAPDGGPLDDGGGLPIYAAAPTKDADTTSHG